MKNTITIFTIASVLFSLLIMFGFSQTAEASSVTVDLTKLGTYQTGVFNDGAAEISSYDVKTKRLFVINAHAPSVDILDISNPANPQKINTIDITPYGASANSVAVNNKLIAVAVEATNKQDSGSVVFFDTNGNFLKQVTVGALPDMLTFTPNGNYVLVANEGEPTSYCTPSLATDPEGSVSIIKIPNKISKLTQADVTNVGFTQFNGQEVALKTQGIRIYGPGASAAQDFEPEYIAVSKNSRKAWITLQENNAIAVLDIKSGVITGLLPLGFKDHSAAANGFDASDRDGPSNSQKINIANWPVKGIYEPDGIAFYRHNGQRYLVTANEGDTRDWPCFNEEVRVGSGSVVLDPAIFPNAAALKTNAQLGRLTITNANGNTDADPQYEELYVPGTRSFSIWSKTGTLIFDSEDAFEQITASQLPVNFNANNDDNNSFDTRSDNKGPEPEGVTLGKIKGHTFAFIGLERIGGIMVYDISNPQNPEFKNYVNNRDFTVAAQIDGASNPLAGDLGPEGVLFIHKKDSPNGKPLLVIANEISGTTTIYEIKIGGINDHNNDDEDENEDENEE